MKALIKKIAECKDYVKNIGLKKEGRNTFSNYDYFTPAQVEHIVYDACKKFNLVTKFNLIRGAYGISGVLSVIDVETGEKECYEMATDIPEIKATNIAQQLGGCMTYTERYLKMTAFGIIDNNLDFDTTESTEKRVSEKPAVTEWLSEEQFNAALNSDSKGITATLNAYDGTKGKGMKKQYRDQLLNKLKQ